MTNLLSIFNSFPEIKNIVSYFSCEILLLVGVILNLSLLFFKKRINTIKLSNFFTSLIFGINTLALSTILLFNCINLDDYNLTLIKHYFEADFGIFSIKILINIFMLFFVLISAKYIKKYRYKVPSINSIVLLLALTGCLLLKAESYIVTYLLLETASILVYKFASNMRARKFTPCSIDYIILSTIATSIFVVFLLLGLGAVKQIQMSIINVCLSIAVLMKIGIFPIYNFLIAKPARNNLPFSLLLFGFLPWVGIIAFNKMATNIMPSDEIYQISMIVFLVATLATFAFYASKHRNLIKFFANFSYFMNGFCALGIIYFQENRESIWLSAMFAFAILAIYSLLSILKTNLKIEKIYVANMKGIFLNNRLFAFLFSAILIIMTGLIPSGIMREILKITSNIYVYDETGFITICALVVFDILILFNCLKIVQTIYTFDKSTITLKLTKRTTLYYVVPVVVIIFLLLKIVL